MPAARYRYAIPGRCALGVSRPRRVAMRRAAEDRRRQTAVHGDDHRKPGHGPRQHRKHDRVKEDRALPDRHRQQAHPESGQPPPPVRSSQQGPESDRQEEQRRSSRSTCPAMHTHRVSGAVAGHAGRENGRCHGKRRSLCGRYFPTSEKANATTHRCSGADQSERLRSPPGALERSHAQQHHDGHERAPDDGQPRPHRRLR